MESRRRPRRETDGVGSRRQRQRRGVSHASMWTDAYRPATIKDLLIRKNKVEEMLEWIKAPGDPVCVLSGPAGCGKSVLVRMVADACGREIVEYVGQVQVGRSPLYTDMYESKLDSYESFCTRAWMPTFESLDTVVVLDDVPITVGQDQVERLIKATLRLLSRSKKTVIMCTEVSSKDSSEHQGYRWEESSIPKALIQAIDVACHPTKISLNPIPKATMVKHLCMIASKENIEIPKSDIQDIAEQSQGDLSHAILTLQFAVRGTTTHAVSHRDSSLSLFHGLGKLLYNKRLPDVIDRKPHDRPPMDGFDPEDTVHASGLSGTSVAAFLHENIPSFVDDEHIDDISHCLDEISFSDVISCHRDTTPYYGMDDCDAARGMSDLIASMISSRGICYWNTHPAPRSWKPLKAPQAFKVEHARRTNVQRLQKAAAVNRVLYGGSLDESTCESMATEMVPYLRLCHSRHVYQQPRAWDRYWQGTIYQATPVWMDTGSIHMTNSEQGMPSVPSSSALQGRDDVAEMEDPIE